MRGSGGYGPVQSRKTIVFLLAAFMMAVVFSLASRSAFAVCDDCDETDLWHGDEQTIPPGYTYEAHCELRDTIRCIIRDEHQITTNHILEEFEDQEEFLEQYVWDLYLHPAWMMMTEQLVHTAMFQMLTLGSMIDAKQQLETQTLFQKLSAKAHQDYHPSHDMCVIGTNIRSLASAERNYEYSTYVYSQRGMDRQLGNLGTAAARGEFDDHCLRLRQFRARYCDLRDNNEHMNMICNPDAANIKFPECLPAEGEQEITGGSKNKDISFIRTVDRARTLDIDFYTPEGLPELTEDEQDTFALGSNLYGSEVMFRIPESSLHQRQTQDELLDLRTIAAKRAVAEHSYNTIVGMKALGTEESFEETYPYMLLLLHTLGLGIDGDFPEEELALFLGERPSYNAQMEIFTKRIFQAPDFFTDLYDEPVNVDRKGVALQAIDLMQSFDMWNSYLRTEAMLSVVLELELLRLHTHTQNRLKSMRGGGLRL